MNLIGKNAALLSARRVIKKFSNSSHANYLFVKRCKRYRSELSLAGLITGMGWK